MKVPDDVRKEHEKEAKKLKKTIARLSDIVANLKNRNAELDKKRKKALKDYYEAASKLEDTKGLIVKLTAQANHNYENSSRHGTDFPSHIRISFVIHLHVQVLVRYKKRIVPSTESTRHLIRCFLSFLSAVPSPFVSLCQ